VDPLR